jgi:hypothetical protein
VEGGDEGLFTGDLGDGGEGAEDGVMGDLFDDLFFFRGRGLGLVLLEVAGGDVEAVEHNAGAAVVEVVGGEAGEDLAEGVLDGGVVLGRRELEYGGAGAAGAESDGVDGQTDGVVVVAELLALEGGAAAAAASGEDVAALVAGWFLKFVGLILVGHGVPPPGGFAGKIIKSLSLTVDRSLVDRRVKCEGPAGGAGPALIDLLVLFYQMD